jgi:ABC-type transport system substrate-binding protein
MRNEKSGQSRASAAALMLALAAVAGLPRIAAAETVLRIGMTAADIPRTLGQPDQGFEGNRFTGLTMYDALTMWDLSSADKPSVMIPGLATEWAVNDADKKKWTFKLRPGVTFHDGGLECRKSAQAGRTAVRSEPGWRDRISDADAGFGPQDRRHDGGIDHQGAR